MRTKSKRRVRRGHWPKGKRRSPLPPKTARAAIRRIRLANDHGLSLTKIACSLGVTLRAVRRWLSGEHQPMPHSLRRLKNLPHLER